MKIEDIKRYGAMLGIEAEINVQHNIVKDSMVSKNYAQANEAAKSLVELTSEMLHLSTK